MRRSCSRGCYISSRHEVLMAPVTRVTRFERTVDRNILFLFFL
jgi:hypothetical protein